MFVLLYDIERRMSNKIEMDFLANLGGGATLNYQPFPPVYRSRSIEPMRGRD